MSWKDKINKKYMQISLYVIITVVIIYALSLVVKNAPQILTVCMHWLGWLFKVIKPVVLGFVFAYLMDPAVGFFERRYQQLKTKKGLRRVVMPRTWGTVTAVLLLMIAIVGLVSLLVYTVTDQIRLANLDDIIALGESFFDILTDFYNSILRRLGEWNIQSKELEQYVTDASAYIVTGLMNFAKNSFGSVSNISGAMTTLIFSFIIGIYFLIDGRMFLIYIRKISKALFSERLDNRLCSIVGDLDTVFSGYIRGQLIDAFVMMVLISLVLSITGVKFAILIGIFAGIGNLIPYFGPIVAYVSTTAICLLGGEFNIWIISMIALFVIQFIDGNVIGPKLLSHSIQIHPLIIIVSIIFGSALGGFLGMLLAVPVGAYVKLIFTRFIDYRLSKKQDKDLAGKI